MAETMKPKARAKKQGSTAVAKKVCGLCGRSGKLRRTECCGNWVCDDHEKYQLFSYVRNSCARKHDRYTVCSMHDNEGHEAADWKTCPECREYYAELEMFVWGDQRVQLHQAGEPAQVRAHALHEVQATDRSRRGRLLHEGRRLLLRRLSADAEREVTGVSRCPTCGGVMLEVVKRCNATTGTPTVAAGPPPGATANVRETE